MKTSRNKKKQIPFEVNKSKEELRREISVSLNPEERLHKLTRMMHFNKQFSENYHKAIEKRLKEDNAFILK